MCCAEFSFCMVLSCFIYSISEFYRKKMYRTKPPVFTFFRRKQLPVALPRKLPKLPRRLPVQPPMRWMHPRTAVAERHRSEKLRWHQGESKCSLPCRQIKRIKKALLAEIRIVLCTLERWFFARCCSFLHFGSHTKPSNKSSIASTQEVLKEQAEQKDDLVKKFDAWKLQAGPNCPWFAYYTVSNMIK